MSFDVCPALAQRKDRVAEKKIAAHSYATGLFNGGVCVVYNFAFGIPALLLFLAGYLALQRAIGWEHYYFSWVIAMSMVAFAYYGLDKGLSKARWTRARIPETVLNLVAVLGGTPGAWLGRTMFRHKTNLRKHWLMFAILIVSSLLHVYVLHTLYSETLG
jgi:uncharacterized membrane protein YsdA (DUF1294 family)